jgi:hypothetical protein
MSNEIQKAEKGNQIPRRSFLYAAGAVVGSRFLSGCALQSGLTVNSTCDPTKGPCVANPQPVPVGSISQINVTASATTIGSIGSRYVGLSYDKDHIPMGLFNVSNATLIALCDLLGESVLRIGGNTVETTVWTPSGSGGTTGQVAPPDIDALAAFAQATGWKVIYGVALATSTPAIAAAEAAYVVKALGSSLLAIEIGNEPDDYSDSTGVAAGYPAWSFSQYLAAFKSFAAAILATTPSTPLAGPASGYSMTYFEGLAEASVPGVSLLTQHYYRGNGASTTEDTMANLIAYPDTQLIDNYLEEMQPAAAEANLPWRMGETNSFYGQPQANTSNAHGSALWSLDHLFTMAQYGSTGANFHGGDDTTTGYSPIASQGATIVGPRPLFYGMYFFTLAGVGTLLSTSVAATALNVSAYTVQKSSGGWNVTVVNKDPMVPLQVTLTMPSSLSSGSLSVLTNSGGLSATSGSTIQGMAISNTGVIEPSLNYTLTVSGDQVSFYVPAASAVLAELS